MRFAQSRCKEIVLAVVTAATCEVLKWRGTCGTTMSQSMVIFIYDSSHSNLKVSKVAFDGLFDL